MTTRDEFAELLLRLISDSYRELANTAELIRGVPKEADVTGWNAEEVAARANIIIETINEAGDLEGIIPNIIEYQEELSSDLNDAKLILEQYAELLDSKPGRGAIKGFMVRGALSRIDPILEQTLHMRAMRSEIENKS